MIDPSYPIGKFQRRESLQPEERRDLIDEIAAAPAHLREAVRGLSESQLDTPYREGGWTVRQVVHHVPESHLNAYCRLKLALTEEVPTIRPYDEAAWAATAEVNSTPIEASLTLLESLHVRWTILFRALSEEDFQRTFRHPEHAGTPTIDWLVALYAWHGRHHVAHITSLRERMGW
ncbi:MAG: YfiT family bacillithiol transferase [Acidobacteriota bacterium]